MAGGAPGDLGRCWIERADGSRTQLSYADQAEMQTGDVFVIHTPGGGGYGASDLTETAYTAGARDIGGKAQNGQ